MRRDARLAGTVLVVLAVGAPLLGCPKKISKPSATPQPKVSELVGVTRPTPPSAPTTTGAGTERGAGSGEATPRPTPGRQSEDRIKDMILASRGEDIPIKESPTLTFVEPSPEERSVLRPIYFEYNKSNIRPEYQPVLEDIAKWMLGKEGQQLLVEGHCDERGTDEYNLALGERRALSVRRYLIALGVPSDRVHTISYGEEKPAAPGSNETAWAKNRRAEFKVAAQ